MTEKLKAMFEEIKDQLFPRWDHAGGALYLPPDTAPEGESQFLAKTEKTNVGTPYKLKERAQFRLLIEHSPWT